MRVLMLTTRFSPDHGGGAKQALNLCHKLSEREVKTFVITGSKERQVRSDVVSGIPVIRLPLSSRQGLGLWLLYGRHLSLMLSRRSEYDLIHAHAIHHHAYAGFLAGQLLGKPAIAKFSGLGADTPARIRKRRFGSVQVQLLSLATRLVATSQELYDQAAVQGIPRNKLVKIPNGTDIEVFRPVSTTEQARLRAKLQLPPEALIGIFVGAVRYVKGIDVLARAWHQVERDLPQLHLYLVGAYEQSQHWEIDPAYIDHLKQDFSATRSVNSRIHFVGQVTNVADYLNAADFFVFPSRSEGMPNALLEAMACGLPYVATKLGVIEEISPRVQRPYLVPADDAEALAEALLRLVNNRQVHTELATAVRQTVEKHFSLDAVADQYVALYHSLLER